MQKTDWVCLREIQKSLDKSVKKLLESKIEKFGVGHLFTVQERLIKTPFGGVIIFQGMQDHTAESIKSLEGFDGAWFEEAQTMSEKSLMLLRPTLRKVGSELWFSWNPDLPSDPIDIFFRGKNPPPGLILVQANYTDNPWFPDVLEQERLHDLSISADYHAHVWLGEYNLSKENAVIPLSWILASVDAHIKLGIEPSGIRSGALDVADRGDDLNAFGVRHGVILTHIEEWSGKLDDIFGTAQRSFRLCEDHALEWFFYDGDGLGAGVRGDSRVINEQRQELGLKPVGVYMFRGSDAVTGPDGRVNKDEGEGRRNKDYFANAKAQWWWALRTRFKITFDAVNGKPFDPDEIISLSDGIKELGKLISELSRPTYKFNGAGKMLIDKSPDGVKSPNMADALMMLFSAYKNSNEIAVASFIMPDHSEEAKNTCAGCAAFNGGVCGEYGLHTDAGNPACGSFYT